jgi:hypothetical protein
LIKTYLLVLAIESEVMDEEEEGGEDSVGKRGMCCASSV